MNGATALDCANTISSPKATKMTTIGTSQNFFSCRRNSKNCPMTLDFFMMTSEHAFEMRSIAISCGVQRPALELLPAARERILAEHAPHQRQRDQEHREQHRQQNARVDVGEHARKSPPERARPFEQLRRRQAEEQQNTADRPQDLGTTYTPSPPQDKRDEDEHRANRDAKRSFRILRAFCHTPTAILPARQTVAANRRDGFD